MKMKSIPKWRYQRLVRYTEVKIRHGVRLDQAMPGDDEDTRHPLMGALVSDDGNHPLTLLEREEYEAAPALLPALEHSQAVAAAALSEAHSHSIVAGGFPLMS